MFSCVKLTVKGLKSSLAFVSGVKIENECPFSVFLCLCRNGELSAVYRHVNKRFYLEKLFGNDEDKASVDRFNLLDQAWHSSGGLARPRSRSQPRPWPRIKSPSPKNEKSFLTLILISILISISISTLCAISGFSLMLKLMLSNPYSSRFSHLSASKSLSLHSRSHYSQFNELHLFLHLYNHQRVILERSGDIESNPGPYLQAQNNRRADEHRDDGQNHQQSLGDSTHQQESPRSRCDLQVMTYNVRGLTDPKKLRHLVNNCYKASKTSANSFFLFQETYVMRLDLLNYLWRGEFHLTPGLGNSQGCLTLLTAPYKIIHSDNFQNRAHVLVLNKNDSNNADLILVNAYAPNGTDNEKLRFFEELMDIVSDNIANYDCENVMFAGDLNLIFAEDEIKNRAYSNAERRISNAVKGMLDRINLKDAWEAAPCKQYTWSTNRTGQEVFSTLDRVFFRQNEYLLKEIRTDWSLSLSDHAAVIASFQKHNVQPGGKSRIARLDPRLLMDPEGRTLLESTFRELKEQVLQEWNPFTKLEFLKMSIRTAVNEASGKIKAKLRDKEAILNSDINSIVSELSEVNVAQDRKFLLMSKLDDLRQLKRSLVEQVGTRLEQRTARKWYNEGELSNRYFFNLLNRKTSDEISAILNDNGTEEKDPKNIESLIRNFYKDLYESVPDQIDTDEDFFRHVQPVPPNEAAAIDANLTLEELTATLQTCSDSAPGPDGIPYSYLKFFWNDVGPALLNAWLFSLETNELPTSHQISYLKLIPKAGKDPRVIANLRPITLSNTDHKLITKTYARKLTKIVDNFVGGEQTAYIPGRLINDNIRAMLSTIDLANRDDAIDGVVISLDAKKAFDSVDHRYIRDCLRAFGLDNFVPIFDVLYTGLKSKIIINGKVVEGYSILKGVKQGDALSCIIFVLCMEPLIRNIKHNDDVKRIESDLLPITVPNVYGFADDVSVITKNSQSGVQAIFTEYESFTKVSGLLLNANKTEILCFNKDRLHIQQFPIVYNGSHHVLLSKEQIKINGIIFLQDPDRREDINVAATTQSMEKLLMSWSTRRLTLLGRILIVKTYAISKLIFVMQSIMLNDRSLKAVIKIVFKYLWNKNLNANRAPERLKRSIMIAPLHVGGFGMIDVAALANSLDLRAYGRLISSTHPFFVQVKSLIDTNDLFNVAISKFVDGKLKRGIELLNKERCKILSWPTEIIVRNANLCTLLHNHKLKYFLKPAGRQSLNFFIINNRMPNPSIGQLSLAELRSVQRHLKYPVLARTLTALINLQINVGVDTSPNLLEMCPVRDLTTASICNMSSKVIRLNQVSDLDQMINVYKSGPILDPGEVLAWTKRKKKLTSTRHKNIILRVIHGDVFVNSRLFKFGLIEDPKCINCQEPIESILHRLVECPKATEAWKLLDEAKTRLGLQTLPDLSLESLLGIKGNADKIELTLNAELIHKLTTRSEVYCPKNLTMTVIKFVSYAEKLDATESNKFKRLLREGL